MPQLDHCALAAALNASFDAYQHHPAITGRGWTATYGQVRDSVAHLAAAYRAAGVKRGDRVIVCMPNRPAYLLAAAAAWECGAVHVGVDAEYTEAELSRVIEITGARLVVHAAGDKGRRAIDRRATWITIGDRGEIAPFDLPACGPEVTSSRSQDAAVIFISSGTTGTPKATVGFDGNLSQRWTRLAGWLGFRQDDVHLAHLPLSHGFGFMMAIAALLSGGRLVTLEQFSADRALDVMASEGVTVFGGSPTHFRLLLNSVHRAGAPRRRLRLSIGTAATFAPLLVEAIWKDLSVNFVHMYGSSEGVGVATADREDIRRGSVGRPMLGSTRIVGADREVLPIGEIGEIAFSRRVYPVAYWAAGSPPEEEQSEWYYSGDLGRLDDEGRLYVFGRLKHQIDRGGIKIDPVEVERALLNCPEVADAAVLGIPDSVMGETVCACVVPENGTAITLEQLRERLGENLASYKLPTSLRLLDAIPRTVLGKTDLGTLRARCTERAAR